MRSLEEQVTLALKFYGEAILSEEGKIDCFKKYGYNVWEHAKNKYLFDQTEHIVPKEMKEKWEKDKEKAAGIATGDTLLEF